MLMRVQPPELHVTCVLACRRANFWLPWKCHHEEHKYELCQYAGYKRRLLKQSYLKHKEQHGLD
jgi:NADH-ubiquinone oxidoreductase B18 subunit (NDUFB7)